jgi:hypothetical protein
MYTGMMSNMSLWCGVRIASITKKILVRKELGHTPSQTTFVLMEKNEG